MSVFYTAPSIQIISRLIVKLKVKSIRSHDKLAEGLYKYSSVLYDQAIVLVVGHSIPAQLDDLPQQGGLPSVCMCVFVCVCVCVCVCVVGACTLMRMISVVYHSEGLQ